MPQTVERIVLVGFMGAGKSTIGPILADRLSWKFLDADHQLQAEEQATIVELFNRLGEPAFRRKESLLIQHLLAKRNVVISLGGGAIEDPSTRALLYDIESTCTIFLKAPLEVLIDRCERQPDAAIRPILRQRDNLHQRFQSRLPHYESAHHTVDTEGLSPNQVTDHILKQLDDVSTPIQLQDKAITT